MSAAYDPVQTRAYSDLQTEILRIESFGKKHNVIWRSRNITWRCFGQGPSLVLMHGGHGSWLHWIRNIEALAQDHTVWLPDLPGFGESADLDLPPHSPDRLRQLVLALSGSLDALIGPGASIDLVGFSFGALVAAHLAAERGGIRRMALLGPAGHGGVRRQSEPMVNWRLSDPILMREALRQNIAALLLHNTDAIDELAMSVHEQCCVQTRFRSKAFSRGASLRTALKRLDQPLLLIWGEHDVTCNPVDIAQSLTEEKINCDWCLVPNAGHWVQFERAKEINQLLHSWLSLKPLFADA